MPSQRRKTRRQQRGRERQFRVLRALGATLLAVAAGTGAAVGADQSPRTAQVINPAAAARLAQRAEQAAEGSAGSPRPSGSRMTERLTWPDDAGTSRVGRVTVSKTQNLSPREIVRINWSGFLPTTNADGPESTHQAPQSPLRSGYPVVLLECQGDDPATMTPEDCPIPNPNRFYYYANKDALETPEVQAASSYDSRSFINTKGKLLAAPGPYQNVPMPSDYSDENVSGTNWYATWSESNGTRQDAKFEVRSTLEAPESLGCGDPKTRLQGACSIVVIPIRPMDCVDTTSCLPPNRTRGFSADYHEWQSASNWRNKFVFPVTFRPFPNICDLDARPAVPTAGSELLDEAMLSWVPKFCRSKGLFKLSFTRISDDAARRALVTGAAGKYQSDLAFTTKPVISTQERPIVNAPVAVTGFVVALAIDNLGYEEITNVRLDARLLAKLVTESYYAPPIPYLSHNPEDLLHDPEFRKLNPDLAKKLDPSIQIDNPVMVQGSPDLVWEVTRYIASDPAAVRWLNGKPDPWGMKVNPNYQGDKWPVPNASFQMRDDWTDPHAAGDEHCTKKPIMEQESQFVYNLLAATIALVDRQPQSYNVCAPGGQGGNVWGWTKPPRQAMGQRAMIAITDWAHAEQYQLPSAALRNAAGKYITPSLHSLQAALRVANVDAKTKTITDNMASKAKKAYPGMMVVNAAAPTHGLDKKLAAQYAHMIRWLATTGQTYGDAAGQLPRGYLALPQDLQHQAIRASHHVAAQDSYGKLAPPKPVQPPPTPQPTRTPTPSNHPASGTPPSANPTPTPATAPTTAHPTVVEPILTQSASSDVSKNLLPALMLIGAAGLVLSPVLLLVAAVRRNGGVAATWRAVRRGPRG